MKGFKDNQKKYTLNIASSEDVLNADASTLNDIYDWGFETGLKADLATSHEIWTKGSYVQDAYAGHLPIGGSILSSMDPYQGNPELRKLAYEDILKQWSGTLVRFHPHTAYSMLYSPVIPPIKRTPSQTTSRQDWTEEHYTSHGTVISISSMPNYKGQWHATVLWPDGLMSYENIGDLIVVFPEPGTATS
jgi:hypothetical protein